MKIKSLPEINYLKECFIIDNSLNCGLRWQSNRPEYHFSTRLQHTRWIRKYSNQPSGSILGNGYYYSRLSKNRFPNHRIIYALHNNTTDFNNKLVDHIDNNKLNNNPTNLRLATNAENQHNSNKPKHNTSGYKNISFSKKHNKYKCSMRFNGNDIYIGLYKTIEEAITARDTKLKELVGDFYRV